MQITELLDFFNNLPPSVLSTENSPNLSNLIGAVILNLSSYTTGWEGYTADMDSLLASSGNFLDVIGGYIGITRESEENDQAFAYKISYALSNNFASSQGMLNALKNIYGLSATIQSVSPVGFSISLQSYPSSEYIDIVVNTLRYSRPAGVPFYFYSASGAPTIGASLYLGANLNTPTTSYASNSFLGGGGNPITYSLLPNTNCYLFKNPTYPYFTDPVLTGQIAV